MCFISKISTIFFLVAALLLGCSDNKKDINRLVKPPEENVADMVLEMNVTSEDTYNFENNKYKMVKKYEKGFGFKKELYSEEKKCDTSNEINSTLPDKKKGEFDNIDLNFIDNNTLYLISTSYYIHDKFNTNWKLKIRCNIIEGSRESYLNGETIKAKPIESRELDNINSVYTKAALTRDLFFNPYKSSFNYSSADETYSINKKRITYKGKSSISCKIKFDEGILAIIKKG